MQKKQQIRTLLTSLVNQRQKQSHMGIRSLSGSEARAITVIKNELDYRRSQDEKAHIRMVKNLEHHIRILMPGPGSYFHEFRSQLIELIEDCKPITKPLEA